METNNSRSIEEINNVLHLAKLSENDIIPTSQTVYFTEEGLHNHDYKFLQLDQHLSEVLNEGQILYIKGDDNESAVLCTDKKTYEVCVAETSNSLLLVNNMKFSEDIKDETERQSSTVTVCGIFYDYLEVTPGKPHLKKLQDLLDKTVYSGPELEHKVNQEDLVTYDELKERIQASELELKQALTSMSVVTINEKVRVLDFEYHFRVLTYMLKLIDENSWALDEVDYEETLNALKDIVPEEVLTCLFEKYTEEANIIDGTQLYSYKEAEVCKFFARVLLYGSEKFNLEEFLQAWAESVPEGMSPSEDFLYGIAIVNRKVHPNIVSAFPESQLPEEINARFSALFRAKEKWTVPEITPYVQRLATEKLDVNALLAKHARASKVDGVKFYSAKHGK